MCRGRSELLRHQPEYLCLQVSQIKEEAFDVLCLKDPDFWKYLDRLNYALSPSVFSVCSSFS